MHKEQIQNDVLQLLGEINQEYKVSGRYLFQEGVLSYKNALTWLLVKKYWIIKKETQKPKLEIMKSLSIEYDVTVRHIKYLLQ